MTGVTGAVLLLALLLTPAGSPWAQAPAAARLLVERLLLPNGLVVLLTERHALLIVTARVAVAGAAVLDPTDKPGLANLAAIALSLGTSTRTVLERPWEVTAVVDAMVAIAGAPFAVFRPQRWL